MVSPQHHHVDGIVLGPPLLGERRLSRVHLGSDVFSYMRCYGPVDQAESSDEFVETLLMGGLLFEPVFVPGL